MAREVDGCAPVLPRPDEEDLHSRQAALHRNRENVRLFDAIWIDVLLRSNMRERPNPVAQGGSAFKFHVFRGGFHPLGEVSLQIRGFAAQEISGLIGKIGIFVWLNQADARRRAAFDLMQHARALAG